MPEGDTVFRAARRLDEALGGHDLSRVDLRVPDLATAAPQRAHCEGTIARGKHLLTRLRTDQGRWTLHTHLRMEGSWHVYREGQRWRRPAHQARVVLADARVQAVGFSLGVVELLPTEREDDVVGHLGPDLLGPDWDAAEALTRLRSEPDRALSEALLDQRNLAGIGNMYMAELCFLQGVPPDRPVGEVAQLERIVQRARTVLQQNTTRAIQSTTGDLRRGRNNWVYRRDGRPCMRCGALIRVAMRVDPAHPERGERASYWCPHCQPGTAN